MSSQYALCSAGPGIRYIPPSSELSTGGGDVTNLPVKLRLGQRRCMYSHDVYCYHRVRSPLFATYQPESGLRVR
jgi:hypothetical protein